ncbi:acetate/propionate family kinase [Lactobacillus terrae]|uniref:acetate/propionate family kinase n=1 Tax=Lactobacillus terrae TaxID=2269374 RepID=UPI000C1B7442|nr:acetate kinase [Lactobacillus terrae]
MKVMVINAGSSTLKWKLFAMPEKEVQASGMIDRMGFETSTFSFKYNGKKVTHEEKIESNKAAIQSILDDLIEVGLIKKYDDISAFGHRVVAGGEDFKKSTVITKDNIDRVFELAEYAPLHNKVEATFIQLFEELVPSATQVAVFDTSYFTDIPEVNYLYSLKYEYYEKYKIRRYGAHGTSHRYITRRLNEILGGLEDKNVIILHLGSGASISAIQNGKPVDISMGFTPLAGITMSSRTGDIDASIIPYLMEKLNITDVNEIITKFNKESGLLGISGISPDMRDIRAQEDTNPRAKLAIDVYVNRIVKYIGSYAAEMGGLDAIAFTAGVGENSPETRGKILDNLQLFGIKEDHDRNYGEGDNRLITTDNSKVAAYVIPTDEELMIAHDTYTIVNG